MASLPTEPPPPGPTPLARQRSGVFIGVFVLLQLIIPLTYLGREDATDERFTWRSLSVRDAPSCETHVSLERLGGERVPIAIESQIHQDWLPHLQRGRKAVVDAFLRKQCAEEGAEKVELVSRCEQDRESRSYTLRCGAGRAYETTRTAAR